MTITINLLKRTRERERDREKFNITVLCVYVRCDAVFLVICFGIFAQISMKVYTEVAFK